MSFSPHPPTGWRNFTIPFLNYVFPFLNIYFKSHLLPGVVEVSQRQTWPMYLQTERLSYPFLEQGWVTTWAGMLPLCPKSFSSDRRCSLESFQSDLATVSQHESYSPEIKSWLSLRDSSVLVADSILSNWKEKCCLGSFSIISCLQGYQTLRLSKMISVCLSVHTSSLCKRKCIEGRHQGKQWRKVGYGSYCWPQEMKRV